MPATKKTDAARIADVADRNGWGFRGDYPGRGMFGLTCPGITCDPSEAKAARAAVRRAGVTGEPSQDGMGRDVIVYWPFVESDPSLPGRGED